MRTFSHLRLDVSYMLRGYAQAESSKVPGRYFFFGSLKVCSVPSGQFHKRTVNCQLQGIFCLKVYVTSKCQNCSENDSSTNCLI